MQVDAIFGSGSFRIAFNSCGGMGCGKIFISFDEFRAACRVKWYSFGDED